jgi:hypothetical protein
MTSSAIRRMTTNFNSLPRTPLKWRASVLCRIACLKKKPSNSSIPAQECFARLPILAFPFKEFKYILFAFFVSFVIFQSCFTPYILQEVQELSRYNIFGRERGCFFCLSCRKKQALGPQIFGKTKPLPFLIYTTTPFTPISSNGKNTEFSAKGEYKP